jgi:Flp pilus assembly protein TadD
LARLNETRPAAARAALRRGEAVTVATSTGVRAGVAVTVGVTGGCTGDIPPCESTCDTSCGSCWNWCGPCSWWWWGCSAYWWPFWGPNWGFGYWYDNFGFWWGGSPYYAAPYVSYAYAPPPIYYSTVIYDAAAPAEEVAAYSQPAGGSSASGAVGVGEGQVSVAPANPTTRPAPAAAQSRAVSEYLALGDQAFRAGRYNDAVLNYAKAVEASPDDGVLHLVFSDALFAAGEYHFAASALRRALELEPKLLDSVVDKHGFYGDPSQLDRHLALLESYLESHYTDDDARLLLAANDLFAGRATRAVELLQNASSTSVRESSAGSLILARAQELSRPEPAAK